MENIKEKLNIEIILVYFIIHSVYRIKVINAILLYPHMYLFIESGSSRNNKKNCL